MGPGQVDEGLGGRQGGREGWESGVTRGPSGTGRRTNPSPRTDRTVSIRVGPLEGEDRVVSDTDETGAGTGCRSPSQTRTLGTHLSSRFLRRPTRTPGRRVSTPKGGTSAEDSRVWSWWVSGWGKERTVFRVRVIGSGPSPWRHSTSLVSDSAVCSDPGDTPTPVPRPDDGVDIVLPFL